MPILRLAIPSPLRRFFDYLPPENLPLAVLNTLSAGARIRVPFGKRVVTGYLQQVVAHSEVPEAQLKRAIEILDQHSLLTPSLLALSEWAAGYYLHPPGEVFPALFPKRLRDGKEHLLLGEPAWQLTDRGAGLPNGALGRSPKQSRALTLLQSERPVAMATLADEDISTAVMRALRDKGIAQPCLLPTQPRVPATREELSANPEQTKVIDAVLEQPTGFACHLLEGVTGSGKTEVYLRLIADCLARGQQALILIPEIGLTPQTLKRFESRFDADIALFHSGLSDAQRYQSWEAARSGLAHIVIGTRSAVFTPLARPGLIIVDEEHDNSFKQQDGFRYSARDVAVKRGQIETCPVILGSATPSLESIHNAAQGRYQHHILSNRAGGASLPALSIVDTRKLPLRGGLSDTVLRQVEDTLKRGQQALLFLNRRGYAPTLQCHDCGWTSECASCDTRMTIHRRQRRLRCHHCGAQSQLPAKCPQCNSAALIFLGLGTEQSEEFLRGHFKGQTLFRVDSDSMQGREAMSALVSEINRGEPCILLGTQMLTKGHHFPGVTLVAVIDADATLFSADFRGEERMAQLLTQVAGRAGRAREPGQVIVQSHYPDHPALVAFTQQSYATHARQLLDRRIEVGLPPAGHLALLRTDCSDASEGENFLLALRQKTEQALPPGATLIGPLPAPMPRRAGKHRFQLLLTTTDRRCAHQAANLLVATAETLPVRRGLKWTIDIDPQDLF